MTSRRWVEKCEVWKPIVGYARLYSVSNLGRVKSLTRKVPHPRGDLLIQGRIRKLASGPHGYPVVSLSKKGKVRVFTVHSLVAKAFLGPCKKGHEVLHTDGNPTNCSVGNLRYGTHLENSRDTVRHGRSTVGETNPQASISNKVALRIFNAQGTTQVIANKFGVSRGVVRSIKRGDRWSSVTGLYTEGMLEDMKSGLQRRRS